jgi:transposase
MSTSYLPYEPRQQQLLPSALQEWLPEDHLAYFIDETVEQLDLRAFHARYEGGGPRNQPYHPAMMVKVLVYGYASGVFSSRRIAQKLHEDVAFRVLAAGNFPAARTIREFRRLHLAEFTALFVQVVKLARELGLVRLGTIAVDGTKVKANASRHKAMSYGRMKQTEQQLDSEIRALIARAQKADEQEEREAPTDLPAEIQRRQDRLEAIRAAKARLEERQRQADEARGRSRDDERVPRDGDGKPRGGGRYQREFGVPPDKMQGSFTDPQARIMRRAGGGFDYCYNAQTAVDEGSHLIVAAEVVNTSADAQQLPRVLEAVRQSTGDAPGQVLADAGYRSEAVFAQLAGGPTELVVSIGREGKVAGRPVDPKRRPHTAAMAQRLRDPRGQAAYRKRKWIAEPPNGWIKNVLGFRQFSLRGLHKCAAEFRLVCLALNLRRMRTLLAS